MSMKKNNFSNRKWRPTPYYVQPDYKLHEFNKRLQHKSDKVDQAWWDDLIREFFDDDATLFIQFKEKSHLRKYTIHRRLIPRYFRSLFDNGVSKVYFMVMEAKENYVNSTATLDCKHATMVTHYGKPSEAKVMTDGHLSLEFNFDDFMRIRNWKFQIRDNVELIPRSILNESKSETSKIDELTTNITECGLSPSTLQYLRIGVILEPMQELMSRQKSNGMNPRDSLKSALYDKWQNQLLNQDFEQRNRLWSGNGRKSSSSDQTRGNAKKRKPRKAPSTSDGNKGGGKKKSPLATFPSLTTSDVMLVDEPMLMGGKFGDEDERVITRLENAQYRSSNNSPPDDLDDAFAPNGNGLVNPMSVNSMTPNGMPLGNMPGNGMPPNNMMGNMPVNNNMTMSGNMPGNMSGPQMPPGMGGPNMNMSGPNMGGPPNMPVNHMSGPNMPNNMPGGNMSGPNMPNNNMSGNMSGPNMPGNNMGGGNMPVNSLPGGNMGNNMPGNNMPGNKMPGSMPGPNMPGPIMPGGNMPGNMTPNSMNGNVMVSSSLPGGGMSGNSMSSSGNNVMSGGNNMSVNTMAGNTLPGNSLTGSNMSSNGVNGNNNNNNNNNNNSNKNNIPANNSNKNKSGGNNSGNNSLPGNNNMPGSNNMTSGSNLPSSGGGGGNGGNNVNGNTLSAGNNVSMNGSNGMSGSRSSPNSINGNGIDLPASLSNSIASLSSSWSECSPKKEQE